jgi:hypothetical protein
LLDLKMSTKTNSPATHSPGETAALPSYSVKKKDLEEAIRHGALDLESATRLWKHLKKNGASVESREPRVDARWLRVPGTDSLLLASAILLATAAALASLVLAWGYFGQTGVALVSLGLAVAAGHAATTMHAQRPALSVAVAILATAFACLFAHQCATAVNIDAFRPRPSRDVFGPLPAQPSIRDALFALIGFASFVTFYRKTRNDVFAAIAWVSALVFVSDMVFRLMSFAISLNHARAWSAVLVSAFGFQMIKPFPTILSTHRAAWRDTSVAVTLAILSGYVISGQIGAFWLLVASSAVLIQAVTTNARSRLALGLTGAVLGVILSVIGMFGYGLPTFVLLTSAAFGCLRLAADWSKAESFILASVAWAQTLARSPAK